MIYTGRNARLERSGRETSASGKKGRDDQSPRMGRESNTSQAKVCTGGLRQ